MKNSLKIFSFLFLFLSLSVHDVLPAIGDWKTFTSARDVRDIAMSDSVIWCATNGGVVKYLPQQDRFNIITNTDGLVSNDIVAIAVNSRGYVWAASQDGRLNVRDPQSGTWFIKTDYRKLTINDLTPYGDSVFVALDIGVSLYDAGKWEVKETYKIGSSNQILIADSTIWVATKEGLKMASLSFPNLMAPSAWHTFTTADGLPDNEVFCVFKYQDYVVAGTNAGLTFYDGQSWMPPEQIGMKIWDLTAWQNELVASTDKGIYARNFSCVWSRLGEEVKNAQHADVFSDGSLWLGLKDEGVARYNETKNSWQFFQPNGPVDNKFNALIFDKNGNLWTASPSGGVSRFDGNTWSVFTRENGFLNSNDIRDLAVDDQNRIWVASWGGGVSILEEVDGTMTATSIKDKLAGVAVNPNYVVVVKLLADEQGNIWILNREANDKRVLAVVDKNNNWQYFSINDGIPSVLVTDIAIDGFGRKWLGTEIGIVVINDNGTPLDKSDDSIDGRLTKEDGLEDILIRSLAYDRDGVMWIGTPGGLNYWFEGQVGVRYNVINDDINCIDVDVRNNKWIGTSGGLSVLDSDGFTWRHYSTSNSPLVSDNVTCFAFDQETGYVYIGTTNGLSRLETPYTKPAPNLNAVTGYPNPFILDGPHPQFYIENLAENASIRIYTPDGFLVKYIPQQKILGSRAVWDGTNDRGEMVASGVYLYLITTENDLSRVGKVAVIKP